MPENHSAATSAREQFDELTQDLLYRSENRCSRVIKQANLKWEQVAEVLAVGGSTRMPQVLEMLRRVTGKEPNCSLSPDEAVAQGAAIHAAICATRAGRPIAESARPSSRRGRQLPRRWHQLHACRAQIRRHRQAGAKAGDPVGSPPDQKPAYGSLPPSKIRRALRHGCNSARANPSPVLKRRRRDCLFQASRRRTSALHSHDQRQRLQSWRDRHPRRTDRNRVSVLIPHNTPLPFSVKRHVRHRSRTIRHP